MTKTKLVDAQRTVCYIYRPQQIYQTLCDREIGALHAGWNQPFALFALSTRARRAGSLSRECAPNLIKERWICLTYRPLTYGISSEAKRHGGSSIHYSIVDSLLLRMEIVLCWGLHPPASGLTTLASPYNHLHQSYTVLTILRCYSIPTWPLINQSISAHTKDSRSSRLFSSIVVYQNI